MERTHDISVLYLFAKRKNIYVCFRTENGRVYERPLSWNQSVQGWTFRFRGRSQLAAYERNIIRQY